MINKTIYQNESLLTVNNELVILLSIKNCVNYLLTIKDYFLFMYTVEMTIQSIQSNVHQYHEDARPIKQLSCSTTISKIVVLTFLFGGHLLEHFYLLPSAFYIAIFMPYLRRSYDDETQHLGAIIIDIQYRAYNIHSRDVL